MTDTKELDALRAKNAELLAELRTAKTKLREAEDAYASHGDTLANLRSELTEIKTANLWADSWTAAGVTPDAAKYARQEIGFDLVIDDDGSIVAKDKATGETVGDYDTQTATDPKEVLKNAFSALRDTHPLFFPRAVGAGATGSTYRGSSHQAPAKEDEPKRKPMATGLR